jgi:exonuclease VII small subunit
VGTVYDDPLVQEAKSEFEAAEVLLAAGQEKLAWAEKALQDADPDDQEAHAAAEDELAKARNLLAAIQERWEDAQIQLEDAMDAHYRSVRT